MLSHLCPGNICLFRIFVFAATPPFCSEGPAPAAATPPCCREGGKVLKVHWSAREGNKMGGRKWTLKHVYSIHVNATNLASATHGQYKPERN